MNNRGRQIYKPQFRFGLGGVSLGNEFNKHTDKDAEATLEAAWAVGVRYFDVAPWYGFGLSERRFGHFLHNQMREDYLLSSKVGKLFKASKNNKHAEIYAPNSLRLFAPPRNQRLSPHSSGSAGIDAFGSIRPCRLSSAQKSGGILAVSEL
jgi:aryl-alcohol dehydrogenase-like predicted oxidoreductase